MPLWYTTKQFAVAAQMSVAGVLDQIRSGKLPAFRAGNGYRIPDPAPEMWARIKHPFRDVDYQLILRPMEVAQIIGVHKRHLQYLRETGKLLGANRDGVFLYTLSDILLYLEKRNAKRRGVRSPHWTYYHSRAELIKWGKKRAKEYLHQLGKEDAELPLPPLEDFERYIEHMNNAPEPLRSTQLKCLLEMSEEWSRILQIMLRPKTS